MLGIAIVIVIAISTLEPFAAMLLLVLLWWHCPMEM